MARRGPFLPVDIAEAAIADTTPKPFALPDYYDPSTPDVAPNVEGWTPPRVERWQPQSAMDEYEQGIREANALRAGTYQPQAPALDDPYAARLLTPGWGGRLSLLDAAGGPSRGIALSALRGENPFEAQRTNDIAAYRGIDTPGMERIPDRGIEIGPLNITPRTLAGFALENVLDPTTWVGGFSANAIKGELDDAAIAAAQRTRQAARQGKTWAEIADQALADASGATEAAIRQQVPDATQIGRVPGTDELFTAGPNGEFVGPTGNLSELRLGREPGMGENVNARRYFTNYGRAQQANLAADEQAAFRAASERAIAGADEAMGIGGGADLTPDEFARLAAKKAAGEALTPEEQDSVLQALGKAMGATTRDEQAIAREALYNGPVPTDMREVDTRLIEGVRSRLGAPTSRTVDDALRAAREAEDPIAARYREIMPRTGSLQGDFEALMQRFEVDGPTPDNRTAADMLLMRVAGGDEGNLIRSVNSAGDLRAQFNRLRAMFPERVPKTDVPTPPAAAADDPFRAFDPAPGGLPEARPGQPNAEFLARMREQANRRAAERAAREGGIGGGADVPGEVPLAARNEFGLTPEQVETARALENAQRAAQGLPPVGEPSRRTLRQVASRMASEAASFPMAAASTYDASAPGRQLAPFLYGHPSRIIPTLKAQFGGMKTANFEARQAELAAKPYARVREIAKVELADVGKDMSKREEQIASVFAEKVLPKSKNFNQGYTLAINEARDWLFKSMLDQVDPALLTPEGLRGAGRAELERIGSLVNASTGRGSDLGGILRQNKIAGIPAFWAPRMLTGRVQLVTALASESPIVRKEAARQLLAFVAVNTALLTMAKASGVADVELDPRSSDFGQLRIGQRRYDLWAGYRPLVNLVTRLGYGIAGGLGWTDEPNMKAVDKGDRDGDLYSKDNILVIARFLRTKLSPIAGEATSQVVGRDLANRDVKKSTGGRAGHAAYQLAVPSLFLRSLVEEMTDTVPRGFAEGGPSGAAIEAGKSLIGNVPYFIGTGGGYYEDQTPTKKRRARQVR